MSPDSLERLLALAIPATYVVSVAVILGEFLALRRLAVPVDRRAGKASLLSGGLSFGGLALANRLVFVGLMHVAWAHRLADLGLGLLAFGVGFVVYDLMFWVAHVAGHRVRLLWCFHAVHHTSEEMRLVAAVRGSALDFVYLPWFFVWIPLLGVHPSVVLIVEAFGRIWGVLTHVHPRFVGRLGALDRWLVTPSVHRVHHGRNPAYIDQNFGEVLTLWDHLFGTWAPEVEPPDYGVLEPVDAGSLADIQLSPWRDLWRDVRAASGLGGRLRALFASPGGAYGGSV
ncbi:MAG: sterol desaturase family protein [Alphaproteobacteria bacterium]|nr:sterol desaturase family protein [Alphaproteobacteria bacterium]